jgi:chitodextrinase
MWNAATTCQRRSVLVALITLAVVVPIIQPPPAAAARAPASPQGVVVTAATTTSLTLAWQPVATSSGYDVYLNGSRVAKTQSVTYVFRSLLCGTRYTLGVGGYDSRGRRSRVVSVPATTAACSGPVVDTTPPTTPSNLTLSSATATSVSLAWTASSDNVSVSGYHVYVDGGEAGTTSSTSYDVAALTCGTSYTLTVEARDPAGNVSQPASVQATTSRCRDTTPPTPPTLLVQIGSTGTSVSLSWTASLDNVGVAGYGMYVNSSQVATTAWTTATFSGLACGKSYTLGVDAYDAAGNHSTQASVVASTAACAAVTTTFSATADTYASEDTQTTVHGNYTYVRDQGATPRRYGYLRFDPEGLSGKVTQATLRVYGTDTSTVGLEVHALADNTWQESTLTWTNRPVFSSTIAASSSRLESGSWASIDVTPLVAGNGAVNFALTTPDTGSLYFASRETAAPTAPQLVVTTGGAGPDTQRPTTPSGLSLGPATATSLSVTWSASTDNVSIAGYSVYLNGNKVGTTSSTAFTFGNLACATAYTLGVEAFDPAGNVSQRASIPATTSACSGGTSSTVRCDKTAQPGLGTAQALLDSLAPGQVGCLHGGMYTGSGDVIYVRSANAGNAGSPITIRSFPGETATLYGTIEIQAPFFTLSNVHVEGDGAANTIQVISSDDVIQDSDITNAWRGRSCMILGDHSYGIANRTLVQRNTFHECGSSSVSNQTHGVYMSYGFDNHVTHNVFYNTYDYAIQMGPDAHRTLFDYNTVDGSAGTSQRGGVVVWDEAPYISTDNRINNNVVTYAATYNLDTWWGGGVGTGNTADGNCLWQGLQGNINPSLSGLLVTNSIIANPLFVSRSARDYHLQTGSPCAGKGAF